MSENNKNANDCGAVQCNKDIFILRREGVAKPAAVNLMWVLPVLAFCQTLGAGTGANRQCYSWVLQQLPLGLRRQLGDKFQWTSQCTKTQVRWWLTCVVNLPFTRFHSFVSFEILREMC